MRRCNQCGSEVSDQYWRVFSVGDELHGCLNCEKKGAEHGPRETRRSPRSAEG